MFPESIKWWTAFGFADFVIFFYICFLIVLFTVDIRFGVASKIIDKFRFNGSQQDSVFIIGYISLSILLLVNIKFEFIGQFFGIVDYYDARYQIFRWKVVHPIVLSILIGSPLMAILCSSLAYWKKMNWLKWAVYGIFFNYLAFAKLISIKKA
ncbi:MAG: hypothetical protein KKC46_09870 [Proteobacteria bacterium]|nr:hypothetical protein [Pseudomonadota bacterium]